VSPLSSTFQFAYVDGDRSEVGDVTELVVDSENVVIRLPGRDHVVAELRRRNTPLSAAGREQVRSEEDDDGRVLSVTRLEFSEYLLDVFEPRPGGGLEHVQTYAVSRVPPPDDHAATADDDDDAEAADSARDDAASASAADKPAMDDTERQKLAERKALGA